MRVEESERTIDLPRVIEIYNELTCSFSFTDLQYVHEMAVRQHTPKS